MSKLALYFGCVRHAGHFLWDRPQHPRSTLDPKRFAPDFPWRIGLLDSGLLINGNVPDRPDGCVYRTMGWGERPAMWHAFYWWDRSVDIRPACNSGFYVRGFERFTQAVAEFQKAHP